MVCEGLSQRFKVKIEYMTYYHDLITEKSWKVLQDLKRQYRFILIGGWAVYLYAKALKSRDIDFICDYEELQKFKLQFDLIKNERLKKYEIHMGEFDVDIYVPFYSELGIPVEDLQTMTKSVAGIQVLSKEALFILKQKAHLDREGSSKGEKDKLDIFALLKSGLDFEQYVALINKYKLHKFPADLKKLFAETREAPELGLQEHAFARLKQEVLRQLKI